MPCKAQRSKKQREIMRIVFAAVNEGRYATTKEIHEKVSYECSYGAIRISVRFLVKAGMLTREPAGMFTHLVPTAQAYEWFAGR